MALGQVLPLRVASGNQLVGSFSTKPAAGSGIIVAVSGRNNLYTADYASSSVTDTAGNTYTKRSFDGELAVTGVEIWVAENVIVPVGTWTVTVACAQSTLQYVAATAFEWSGLAASAFDQQTTATTTTVGATSLAIGATGTLAQADEVVITCLATLSDTADAGIVVPSGFTLIDDEQDVDTYMGHGVAYKVVASTAGSGAAATWTFNAQDYHSAGATITLKLAASGPGVPTQTYATGVAISGTSANANVPSGAAGNTQCIVYAYKSLSVSPPIPSGWEKVGDLSSTPGSGRLIVLRRVLSAAYTAGTVALDFGTVVEGVAHGINSTGALTAIALAESATFGTTHQAPTATANGADTTWVQIAASGTWPRTWTPSGDITEHVDTSSVSGPAIALGSKTVGTGATGAGTNWTCADVGESALMGSLLFRISTGTGGADPVTMTFGGRIPTVEVASVTIDEPVTVLKGSTDAVTATVLGADGLPFEGISVALTSGTTSRVTVASSPQTTNASGIAFFTINGVEIGTSVLTANADAGAATDTATASVSASTSVALLTIGEPLVVTAGASISVLVTAIGTNGLPFSGASVTLASGSTGVATITSSPQTTNGSGVATFTLNGIAAGTSILTATAASGVVTDTAIASVTAIAPPPTAGSSGSAWARWIR